MKAPEQLSAEEWAGQINALTKHPAFPSLVARHAEQVAAVQTKINDLTTSPAETQEYKRALAELALAAPDLLARDLLNTAKNEAKRQNKKL